MLGGACVENVVLVLLCMSTPSTNLTPHHQSRGLFDMQVVSKHPHASLFMNELVRISCLWH